jgi:hypothetical protein
VYQPWILKGERAGLLMRIAKETRFVVLLVTNQALHFQRPRQRKSIDFCSDTTAACRLVSSLPAAINRLLTFFPLENCEGFTRSNH